MSEPTTNPKPEIKAEAKPITAADLEAAVAAGKAAAKAEIEAATAERERDAEKKRLAAQGEWEKLVEKLQNEKAEEVRKREEADRKAVREAARAVVAAEFTLKPAVAAKLQGESADEMRLDYHRRVEEAKELLAAEGATRQRSAGAPGPTAPGGPAAPDLERKRRIDAEILRQRALYGNAV